MGMRIYAGIDEAGYGPLFGPLVVGRAALMVDDSLIARGGHVKDLWEVLDGAVCKRLSGSKGRIAVNDSKKVYTKAAGLKHLERGVLGFAGMCGYEVGDERDLLKTLGDKRYEDLKGLPWYAPGEQFPWMKLPVSCDAAELGIARNMLRREMDAAKVKMVDMQAAVVFEDQFNEMVSVMRSKAAMSFTFVTKHIRTLWDRYGKQGVIMAVDRQSGRSHYRELLAMAFADAKIKVVAEDGKESRYELTGGGRKMVVSFEVGAEERHMPVALASMVSKYTRELMMGRFNRWFTDKIPGLKPTAGYALDGKRFWGDIENKLGTIGVRGDVLRRKS